MPSRLSRWLWTLFDLQGSIFDRIDVYLEQTEMNVRKGRAYLWKYGRKSRERVFGKTGRPRQKFREVKGDARISVTRESSSSETRVPARGFSEGVAGAPQGRRQTVS